ncbi:hypothetical protein I3F58_11475 [Streptomyces sp. MUM 203J]|uniref:hypothetical protein n=1 Tax=Streptomyces sp. MUM 203J TaxID=2791990 RepID=UPI001F043CD5|nr:hypothetical protein [Streptomyces sp. MUM 203J]MCH0540179.1 hypothetical protein [Streptomyces sp. MUM 203J]
MTDTGKPEGSAQPDDSAPRSAPARLLRRPAVRVAIVAGLVGALLGAGLVAWRTDTLPWGGSKPCWDSLDDTTLTALVGEGRTVAEEQTLFQRGSSGRCRVTAYGVKHPDRISERLHVNVHWLDTQSGPAADGWHEEFLRSGMTPLGDGLPGMVSTSHAWLRLPQGCIGTGNLAVVDIDAARMDSDARQAAEQDALARAVVHTTNGVMRAYGCTERYALPEKLPGQAEWQRVDPDALCGIKDLALPADRRDEEVLDRTRSRVGGAEGPARVCGVGWLRRDDLRFTTVADPELAKIFHSEAPNGLPGIVGTRGRGSLTHARAEYEVSCQTGTVVFMAENRDLFGQKNLLRDLFPAYVAAEADRIGCGPLEITEMPGFGEKG